VGLASSGEGVVQKRSMGTRVFRNFDPGELTDALLAGVLSRMPSPRAVLSKRGL
jgi:hypothetical protein